MHEIFANQLKVVTQSKYSASLLEIGALADWWLPRSISRCHEVDVNVIWTSWQPVQWHIMERHFYKRNWRAFLSLKNTPQRRPGYEMADVRSGALLLCKTKPSSQPQFKQRLAYRSFAAASALDVTSAVFEVSMKAFPVTGQFPSMKFTCTACMTHFTLP